MKQYPKKVKQVYEDEAERYNINRFSTKLGRYISETEQKIIKEYTIGNKVLELCCGTGRFCKLFKKRDYVGIDFSSNMLKIAKRDNPKSRFLVLDALKMNKLNEKFDTVFIVKAIKFIEEPELMIAQTNKILNNGGRLMIGYREKNILTSLMASISNFIRIFSNKRPDKWTHGVGNEILHTHKNLKRQLENNGFIVLDSISYLNPLFAFFNQFKNIKILEDFLILTANVYKKHWRVIVVAEKKRKLK